MNVCCCLIMRMILQQELFFNTIRSSGPMRLLMGRCCVLSKRGTACRQAELGLAMESPWLLRSKRRLPSPVRLAMPVPPVEGARSVVYVMREPGIASRNVSPGRSAATPERLTRLRTKATSGRLIDHEPYKLGISASSIPFPLVGVAGYGLRVQGTLAAAVYHPKMRPIYYEDTFGFAVGPSEIVLVFVGVERPFPSGEERRLLSLLYGRAKAHEIP